MNIKPFLLGLATGVILTFGGLFLLGLANQSESAERIQYLDKPVNYENKAETSFKVFQVLDDAALANEASDDMDGDVMYYGNTVLILGKDFYSDQIVTIKNPQRVGTYSYTNNAGMPKTVPVIEGNIE